MLILPDPEPFLGGDARGPVLDLEPLSLGISYLPKFYSILFCLTGNNNLHQGQSKV